MIRQGWDHAVLEVDVESTRYGTVVQITTGDIISLVAAMNDEERSLLRAALGL